MSFPASAAVRASLNGVLGGWQISGIVQMTIR